VRVAFDIGGTFTDVILSFDDRRMVTAKVLSTLDVVGSEIAYLIERSDNDEDVESFVHATTVCSNALIQRTTPDVALITTKGFRDVLEMMGQRGPSSHDRDWERISPLVPRHLRFEVRERILTDGSIQTPLCIEDVEAIVPSLVREGVSVVAVCLINSYVNSAHERLVLDTLAAIAPGLTVSLSSLVHPEIKEYERTSTTVINASLVPVVTEYLDRLQVHLDRFSPALRIMQSNGGTVSASIARHRPMTMVESGPAAGVLAAATVARELALDHVLSFDMGGTTAKACLIEGGQPLEKAGTEVAGSTSAVRRRSQGHALRVPSLDIVEVGAGGGSIAWIDDSGALRAGPASAGADPGPACYGRGGTLPTVTDANVALGYINPDAIADSALNIDREAALASIERHIVGPLGMDVFEAAHGIIEVANATMMRALRAVSTERGRDIRELTLVAFGGSGPVHAASLCERVGVTRVLVPPLSGVFSALGLLLAGERIDFVHSVERSLSSIDVVAIRTAFEEMSSTAVRELGDVVDPAAMVSECSLDLRYGRVASEINVAVETDDLDLSGAAARFQQAHEREFGFVGKGDVQLVNVRLRVTALGDRVGFTDLFPADARSDTTIGDERKRLAYFGPQFGMVPTRVLTRSMIRSVEPGPIIVEEETTTVVVRPGWSVASDSLGNLVMTRNEP
jgi:N-methylhydantoinase A